jgi:uncharacterized protein DUF6644
MLFPLFQTWENMALGTAIRSSLWLFPVIEAFHLLGLAIMGGAVLIVDMRLMGIGVGSRPVSELADNVQPMLIGSLILMLVSGVMLFSSESVKCYYSTAFWVKMTCLLLGIIFTFTIRRNVTRAEEGHVSVAASRLVALTSLLLWSGVGWGGRWIGFS